MPSLWWGAWNAARSRPFAGRDATQPPAPNEGCLPTDGVEPADVADALAIALGHCYLRDKLKVTGG